ncbi:MAG: hypothetical protein IJB10_02575 [Clostridia bacterium]|nr:hypothetical protein [Clostridia bacterium]
MKNLIIKNDLFGISKRLKKIDKSYFVVFNKNNKNYEVHSTNQKGSSLCFVVGKHLNAYALIKAQKTSVRFAKSILKDIFNKNQKLYNKELEDIKNKNIDNLNNYLLYASKKCTDVSFDNANKVIWY